MKKQDKGLCLACGARFAKPEAETREEYLHCDGASKLRCPACHSPVQKLRQISVATITALVGWGYMTIGSPAPLERPLDNNDPLAFILTWAATFSFVGLVLYWAQRSPQPYQALTFSRPFGGRRGRLAPVPVKLKQRIGF